MNSRADKCLTIAYIAGRYPELSETFVRREVRSLQERGWGIVTVSLREPVSKPDHEPDADLLVYGQRGQARFSRVLGGICRRPGRSLKTLSIAIGDMCCPGEPTAWTARIKLVVQCLAAIGLAQELIRHQVRHLHCHFAHAPAGVGMYASCYLGISFSFTGHANDLFQRRSLLKRKLQRAGFVACISQWHRQLYQSITARDPDRYVIVRCGVPTKESGRAQITSTNAPVRILTVARLVSKKGIDTLLAALAQVRVDRSDVQLEIIGDGPEADRLKRLAVDLNVDDAVNWRGSLGNDQVQQAMLTADVFALACREDERGDRDGIPVVLMEAMAVGLPVISGDLPAIRELVEDGRTGLLVDGGSATDCAGALRKLLDDPEVRGLLGEAGRRRVKEEFDLEVNVRRLEQAIFGCDGLP